MYSKKLTETVTSACSVHERLRSALHQAEAVVIGAGAGLSAAAGFTYSGKRFTRYFADFGRRYGFQDMYSGGFYPYSTPEERWAYWSRYIYINRYMSAPNPVYENLFSLVKEKDYFVLTTNVDHCFQKAGFEKRRLFYTQGDYGLFQCSAPCRQETFDNAEAIRAMVVAQGYSIATDGRLTLPEGTAAKMHVPTERLPLCPRCGKPMTMNLRSDDTFVEDAGWHRAAERYAAFLRTLKQRRVLFLELGVGYNTPGIIKYPFWQMTAENPKAVYACLNDGQAYAPDALKEQAICVEEDIGEILQRLTDPM